MQKYQRAAGAPTAASDPIYPGNPTTKKLPGLARTTSAPMAPGDHDAQFYSTWAPG